MPATRLLITCEHGGNRIPRAYSSLFRGYEELLATHRGYDIGALRLAREFAQALPAPLIHSTTSRLLADLNRSPASRTLFSGASAGLSLAARRELLERHYFPYRNAVAAAVVGNTVGNTVAGGGERVIHLSCHSFTPELDGLARRADIGLLFDPARPAEAALCAHWQALLRDAPGGLLVRRNYPYRGIADGITSALRRDHGNERYLGIELEVNQKYALGEPRAWQRLRRLLIESFAQAVAGFERAPAAPDQSGRAARAPSLIAARRHSATTPANASS